MTKGQGKQRSGEGAVVVGARGICGGAFPPWGTCTAVPIPQPWTCGGVETRQPAPAAYSTRRNASLRSAGSVLVNRRRVGGGTAWRLACPSRVQRAHPRGAPSARLAATAATAPHRHLHPPSLSFHFRQGPRIGGDTAAPAGPRGRRSDPPSGLLPKRRPDFPGAA